MMHIAVDLYILAVYNLQAENDPRGYTCDKEKLTGFYFFSRGFCSCVVYFSYLLVRMYLNKTLHTVLFLGDGIPFCKQSGTVGRGRVRTRSYTGSSMALGGGGGNATVTYNYKFI